MYPGIFGGVESQLATDGTNVYAAVINLVDHLHRPTGASKFDLTKGTGEMVALDKATGKIVWDHKFTPAPPYGAASLTNDVVFTTTFDGTALGAQHEDRQGALERQAPGGHQHAGRDRRQHGHHRGHVPAGQDPEGRDRRV